MIQHVLASIFGYMQYEHAICLTSKSNRCRRMIGLDLDPTTLSVDSVIAVCTCWCLFPTPGNVASVQAARGCAVPCPTHPNIVSKADISRVPLWSQAVQLGGHAEVPVQRPSIFQHFKAQQICALDITHVIAKLDTVLRGGGSMPGMSA